VERGLDFDRAREVFAGPTLTLPDVRQDYGEDRYQTYDLLGDRLSCWCGPHAARIATSSRRGNAMSVKKRASEHNSQQAKSPDGELLKRLRKAAWVDPDDAPEWTAEQFERADVYHGNRLIRVGRPPSANPKQALKLRIDPDVVEYFRATGPGWQTRINDTLRRAAKLPPRKYEPIER
jgi:uncharacterized protein (DUF4415 family)/uncharacterized DUF497 family protein